MSKQDYILKKHVRAESLTEAIEMDSKTPVSEAYLAEDKPNKLPEAIGFKTIYPEE